LTLTWAQRCALLPTLRSLEKAGIEFIDGDKPGVRVK
jgi:hypothetical protein